MGLDIALSEMGGDRKFEVPSQTVLGGPQTQVGGGLPRLRLGAPEGAGTQLCAAPGGKDWGPCLRVKKCGAGSILTQSEPKQGFDCSPFRGPRVGEPAPRVNGAALACLCAWALTATRA